MDCVQKFLKLLVHGKAVDRPQITSTRFKAGLSNKIEKELQEKVFYCIVINDILFRCSFT